MLRKVSVKCVHFIKQHYIYAQPTITMNNCITRIAIYSNCSCRVENRVCKQPPFHWKIVQKHRKTFQAPWFYICQVTCHCRTRSSYWCSGVSEAATGTVIFFFIFQPAQYAVLLACFSKDNCSYCLVIEMQVTNINNVPVTNDFRCPSPVLDIALP